MAIEKTKTLTIYKASAGSGKTFTLAKEYMKLVIQNPLSYRNILAVTFTNKATEEMKMRILSQLYGIWKGLPDSQDYMDQIIEELDLSPAIVSRQAGKALELLVHNYNHFRVETIDTFFQNVLRNLARELDLTANLRIELNDYQVEDMAVDELIENLDASSLLLRWIMDYIEANIKEDKSWNVIGQIKKFGCNIFKECYKEHSNKLTATFSQKDFFTDFSAKMREIGQRADDAIKQVVATFEDYLEENSLDISDFSYGASGVCSYFLKLKNGIFDNSVLTKRVLAGMESSDAWVKKSSPRKLIVKDAVDEMLFALLRDTEAMRPKLFQLSQSVKLTMRHINQLRLLNSIDEKVKELNKDANRFLLSDTQNLLHSLIGESDSPFIFEKIGTQLEHIMIDEFQDTSTIQWQNFKVLLEETMSEGKSNLIVGDVKQSIYRWRDGDWRLLNNIVDEFGEKKDQLSVKPLETNYRSDKNIIEFNNLFFRKAADIEYEELKEQNPEEAEEMKNAYTGLEQNVPGNKTDSGLVSIQLLSDDDFLNRTLEAIADHINTLHMQGIPYGRMAVLTRNNASIQQIADYFAVNYPNIELVSDEAFRLDSSLSVKVVIEALALLVHPEDILPRATLVKLYRKVIDGDAVNDTELYVCGKGEDSVEHLDRFLPQEFITDFSKFLTMPLFDLVEKIYSLFSLNKVQHENAYICAFYDELNSFITDYSSDVSTFLEEWDKTLHSKTIQSDDVHGVRILSIHKSKGLEFSNLIIPFCDWKMEKANTTLWCEPEEEPFNELPLVPVDFSSKNMMGTIYEKDYLHEHLQNVVDNMNLLYVAFTRASQNLFVIAHRGNATTRSDIIEQVLSDGEWERVRTVPIKLEGIASEKKTEDILFEYGTLDLTVMKIDEKVSDNVFEKPVIPSDVSVSNYSSKVIFRQSNKSREFIDGDEDETLARQRNYIQLGNVLHNLFSSIHTSDDIEGALKQLELEGIIYDKTLTKEKLSIMLRKRLENSKVADWFSPRWTLFNECSVLFVNEDGKVVEQRPDRVMYDGHEMIVVDFKFGRFRDEYKTQVRNYMALLRNMGYQNIKGYLWFVYKNEIIEVKGDKEQK